MSNNLIKLIAAVVATMPLTMSVAAQTTDINSTTTIADTPLTQEKTAVTTKSSDPSFRLYRMNYWLTGSFCVVASAANVYAIPNLIKGKPDMTDQELQGVNKDAVPWFDRWALQQDPSKRPMYMKTSDYVLPAVIITTGMLGFDKNVRKDWARILLMYYEMHALTFSIYNYSFFGPTFQNKYRPVEYYTDLPKSTRIGGNNRNSMYSGHVATAVASSFFMVKVYCDYHPEIDRKKYLLYALATVPGFAVAYLRVGGLAHFPSDCMIGMTIGAVCGILVPEIHRFKNHKVMFAPSTSPTGGIGLNMTWNIDKQM